MKIYVSRVPSEGLQDHASYDPAGLDMEREDIHLREPIEVDAMISKVETELLVRAEIASSLVMNCARCLQEFHVELRTGTLLNYQVRPSDVVDITEDVRQEIILNYPMIPVCRPDCRGLCARCGQNLNVAVCEHHQAG